MTLYTVYRTYVYIYIYVICTCKNRHLDGDEVRVRLPFSQAFEDLILPSAVRFWGRFFGENG